MVDFKNGEVYVNYSIGDKLLVTTDNWFIGTDGQEYRAVWGTVNGIFDDKESLGVSTNRNSTNWYLSIGNMLIAGCQIHYAIKCAAIPGSIAPAWNTHEGNVVVSERPTVVFNANSEG